MIIFQKILSLCKVIIFHCKKSTRPRGVDTFLYAWRFRPRIRLTDLPRVAMLSFPQFFFSSPPATRPAALSARGVGKFFATTFVHFLKIRDNFCALFQFKCDNFCALALFWRCRPSPRGAKHCDGLQNCVFFFKTF